MEVTLREFRESDGGRVAEWAKAIGSDDYMSRCRPRDLTVSAHSPEAGILWFVIRAGGRDVGTVWLEADVDPDQLILGILLGDREVFGLGIGQRAIGLALQEARRLGRYHTVVLHVRENNGRAIACYEKCGFRTIASGVKQSPSGAEIQYLTMRRYLPPKAE